MTRPATTDHLTKARPTKRVKMAVVQITDSGRGTCSCGWSSKNGVRRKVQEDRIQAHLDKRHGSRGLWM